MDYITDERVNNWLNVFVKKIRKKYKPEKVILFGSRARNEHLLTSDVDIIIVSKKFQGVNWLDRISAVIKDWHGLVNLEPLCYTPKEFQTKIKEIGIVKEALKEGKEL